MSPVLGSSTQNFDLVRAIASTRVTSPRPSACLLPTLPSVRNHLGANSNSPLPQLVLLDLQCPLQHLLGLGPTDRDVHGDLLVTPDGEGSDGVARLGCDGGLTGKLLEHLGGTGQPITRLSDRDVYRVSFPPVVMMLAFITH